VTSADTLLWVGDGISSWDVNNAGNLVWKTVPGNAATEYRETAVQGDTVRFDDTATGLTTVTVNTTVTPYLAITVDHSTYRIHSLGVARSAA
jgi:hypothetical protein